MSKSKSIRILGKHIKGCLAVKAVERGDWDTPWSGVLVKHKPQRFGSAWKPETKGHWLWTGFICNCVGCPAEIWIRRDFLDKAIAGCEEV